MARNDFDWVGEFQEFSNRLRNYFESAERPAREGSTGYSPSADLFQSGDSIIVEVELPGMKKEDIRITMAGNSVEVAGEKRVDRPHGSRVLYAGRKYGSFMRRIELPAGVDVDLTATTASYEQGVLRIVLPKKAKDPGVPIAIV